MNTPTFRPPTAAETDTIITALGNHVEALRVKCDLMSACLKQSDELNKALADALGAIVQHERIHVISGYRERLPAQLMRDADEALKLFKSQ